MTADRPTHDVRAIVKAMTLGPRHERRKVRPLLAEAAQEFDLLADDLAGRQDAAGMIERFRAERSCWPNVRTRAGLIGYLESAVATVLRLREIAAE